LSFELTEKALETHFLIQDKELCFLFSRLSENLPNFNTYLMKSKIIPVFFVFFAMGFADVVGPLVGLARETFELSFLKAQLLSLSGFIMFFFLSIPMGIIQDKRGKRFVLNMGLSIALIGLMIPILNGMYGPKVLIDASASFKFYALLVAILLLGAGATILQVAGNPIMRDVSPDGQFSSNLSLGQSIKAIGSSLGFLIPPAVAMAFGMDWSILFPIFAFMILLTLVWFNFAKIEEKKHAGAIPASFVSSMKLLFGNGFVFLMVLAIFVYVGAEISMSSGVPMLMKEKYGLEAFGLWVSWALFFLPILIGRFAGSAILRTLPAKKFLLITVFVSILGIFMLLLGNMYVTFSGIILIGLGFANIFPLVFSITVEEMPQRTNELSGLMVTAIVGGAIIPPLWGLVADKTTVVIAFSVPLICLLYILLVSFRSIKKSS
jgi:MFS transporter, FHS family, L-fucose permease